MFHHFTLIPCVHSSRTYQTNFYYMCVYFIFLIFIFLMIPQPKQGYICHFLLFIFLSSPCSLCPSFHFDFTLSLSLCLSLSLKNLVLSVGCVRSGAQAQLLGFEDLGTLRFSCVFLLWKFWSKDS